MSGFLTNMIVVSDFYMGYNKRLLTLTLTVTCCANKPTWVRLKITLLPTHSQSCVWNRHPATWQSIHIWRGYYVMSGGHESFVSKSMLSLIYRITLSPSPGAVGH